MSEAQEPVADNPLHGTSFAEAAHHQLAPRRLHLVIPVDQAGGGEGELQTMEIGPLELELGGRLPSVTIAYRTWGALNAARDNAILVLHALTGDSRAAGDGGWWAPLIGRGKAIDTDQSFVICSNIVGGCQGSTGPASIDPLTGRPYAMRFPLITIGDMVNAQRRLVERLGITKLIAIGGSIGGFQALEWATRHADLVRASAPLAARSWPIRTGGAANTPARASSRPRAWRSRA